MAHLRTDMDTWDGIGVEKIVSEIEFAEPERDGEAGVLRREFGGAVEGYYNIGSGGTLAT